MTLHVAREVAWAALARSPVRRAMLGRRRCDELTRIARNTLPEDELTFRGTAPGVADELAGATARRVGRLYGERCGFTFTTFVLTWAIGEIVKALISRWLEQLKAGELEHEEPFDPAAFGWIGKDGRP